MSDAEIGSTRIGNAERESAMNALDVHLNAGRLDAEEYGERAGRISIARTAADLAPLFADLPAPHPSVSAEPPLGRASRSAPPRGAAPPSPQPSRTPKRRPDRHGREALGGKFGESFVAISPIVAVILFFATNDVIDQAWLFFLLIPLSGAIVYGRHWRGE